MPNYLTSLNHKISEMWVEFIGVLYAAKPEDMFPKYRSMFTFDFQQVNI